MGSKARHGPACTVANLTPMSAHCHTHVHRTPASSDPAYRRVLVVALMVNAAMFAAELAASWASGSVALLADSVDFFADAANYALSLAVAGMALATRARAALFKAACMAAFGVAVLAKAAWQWHAGAQGDVVVMSAVMGSVGIAALMANAGVAWMLFRYRTGDANMRSVWLCSRNDAIGNLAVVMAALGVFGSGQAWPDLMVASVMAVLALHGALAVARQARAELAQGEAGVARAGKRLHRH